MDRPERIALILRSSAGLYRQGETQGNIVKLLKHNFTSRILEKMPKKTSN
jgi:hypothetical protein